MWKKQKTLVPVTRELKKLRERDYLAYLKEFQRRSLVVYKKQRAEMEEQLKALDLEMRKHERIKEIEKEIEKTLEREIEESQYPPEEEDKVHPELGGSNYGAKRF
jgi:K+/H+ antiporter YhaU regulatory subunit KhtT|tara:strand:+ start:115 stop:429 length:315 start_codon:yes stop_codon:yes gene_type:complete